MQDSCKGSQKDAKSLVAVSPVPCPCPQPLHTPPHPPKHVTLPAEPGQFPPPTAALGDWKCPGVPENVDGDSTSLPVLVT
jgi:hypothetical protein